MELPLPILTRWSNLVSVRFRSFPPKETIFKNLFKSRPWDFTKPYSKAFYLGYLCHVLVDAAYALTLSRKYFAKQGLFSGSIVHHDVFRFWLDCKCTDIIKNKTIADQISNIDTKLLAKFFPEYIHQIWKGVISRQIMLMPDKDISFNNFVGDKKRFQAVLDNFDTALKDIQEKIDPLDIKKFQDTTQKLLKLAKAELFKPHSTYTIEDLDNIKL